MPPMQNLQPIRLWRNNRPICLSVCPLTGCRLSVFHLKLDLGYDRGLRAKRVTRPKTPLSAPALARPSGSP